jgi:hypothetical protein
MFLSVLNVFLRINEDSRAMLGGLWGLSMGRELIRGVWLFMCSRGRIGFILFVMSWLVFLYLRFGIICFVV